MQRAAKSKIIQEDIEQLAKALKDQHKFFSGKTFLLTGAGGFLGKYIVLLFKHLNERVLTEPLKAILLDNFITGYEQEIISDQNIKFIKHNVIESFKTDEAQIKIHHRRIHSYNELVDTKTIPGVLIDISKKRKQGAISLASVKWIHRK